MHIPPAPRLSRYTQNKFHDAKLAAARKFCAKRNHDIVGEVPVQLGSPNGGPSDNVPKQNIRRTHEYRNPKGAGAGRPLDDDVQKPQEEPPPLEYRNSQENS